MTGYLGRLENGEKVALDGKALRGIADGSVPVALVDDAPAEDVRSLAETSLSYEYATDEMLDAEALPPLDLARPSAPAPAAALP